MATKLNNTRREKLKSYVFKHIRDPEKHAALDAVLYELSALISAYAATQYDQDEMKILAKHKAAEPLQEVSLASDFHNFRCYQDMFNLLSALPGQPGLPDVLVPSVVSYTYYVTSGEEDVIAEKYLEYRELRDIAKKADERVRKAYLLMISTAKTLDELAGVWPEVWAIVGAQPKEIMEQDAAYNLMRQNLIDRGVVQAHT